MVVVLGGSTSEEAKDDERNAFERTASNRTPLTEEFGEGVEDDMICRLKEQHNYRREKCECSRRMGNFGSSLKSRGQFHSPSTLPLVGVNHAWRRDGRALFGCSHAAERLGGLEGAQVPVT